MEVVREEGYIVGLRLQLIADGECTVRVLFVCPVPSNDPSSPITLLVDPLRSKLSDTRPQVFERVVRFGDSPQVVMATGMVY